MRGLVLAVSLVLCLSTIPLGLYDPASVREPASLQAPDIRSVTPDLQVPSMVEAPPAAGRRVRQTLADKKTTDVYHALYLPRDWDASRSWPVLVEYAGNGPYESPHGDLSSGRVEGSCLGYGISGGDGFIWLCLPYLNDAGTANVTRWWGDKPTFNARPTIAYCRKAVAHICKEFGGDPQAVFLCGFSRGAIACNYIGLHDDEVAALWRGFVPYSHYDGVVTTWGYPGAERPAALQRLQRLRGRPQFILHEDSRNPRANLDATRKFVEESGIEGRFTFRSTGFRNHNDAWILRPCAARTALRAWIRDVLAAPD